MRSWVMRDSKIFAQWGILFSDVGNLEISMNPDEGAYDPQIRGTFVFMIHNQCSMILYIVNS